MSSAISESTEAVWLDEAVKGKREECVDYRKQVLVLSWSPR
jgi:hypothetical protein